MMDMRDKFVVEKIQISSDRGMKREEIMRDLNVEYGESIFDDIVSPDALLDKLKKNKKVHKADISIKLPNTILVSIKEREGVAVWKAPESNGHQMGGKRQAQRVVLIDRFGAEITDDIPQDTSLKYTTVFGEGASEHFESAYNILQKTIYFQDIKYMTFVGKRRWDIVLKNGTNIKFPAKDMELASEQLNSLKKNHALNFDTLSMIDMRLYPTKIYMIYTS